MMLGVSKWSILLYPLITGYAGYEEALVADRSRGDVKGDMLGLRTAYCNVFGGAATAEASQWTSPFAPAFCAEMLLRKGLRSAFVSLLGAMYNYHCLRVQIWNMR